MNNVLDIVLTRIKLAIPRELLDLTFTVREPHERAYPVEQMVLEKVIRGIVRKEVNIYGGKQKKIVLLPEYREEIKYDKSDAYTFTGPFSLYRIPPCEREGQAIVDVDGLTYRGNYAGYVPHVNGWAGGADLSTVGAGVMDSHTFASHPPRPEPSRATGALGSLVVRDGGARIHAAAGGLPVDIELAVDGGHLARSHAEADRAASRVRAVFHRASKHDAAA